MTAGRLEQTPKQRIAWDAVKEREELSFDTLREIGISTEAARTYLATWVEMGMLEQHRTEKTVKYYRPVAALEQQSQKPEDIATPHGNMWTAMRVQRTFTPTDVMVCANTAGIEVNLDQVRAYCRQLLQYGVIILASRRPRKGGEQAYRLINDLGPRPPETKRITALFDPNARTFRHINGSFEA